jgi:hypothetical protein
MGTANTLTNLIPTISLAADTVSRELTGLIPSVTRNSSAARAALNETIRFPIVPTYAPVAIASGATGPDPDDSSIGSDTMTISASESVTFWWNGEEQLGLNNAGYYADILRGQFAFTGAIFTDDLSMEGARHLDGATLTYAEAAALALQAGCDLVLHCTGRIADTAALLADGPPLTDRAMERLAAARAARDAFRTRNPAALRALRDAALGARAGAPAGDDPTARPT